MRHQTFVPSPILQPYVRNYWILETENSDCPVNQTIHPFGSFELMIHLKKQCRLRSLATKEIVFSFESPLTDEPAFFYTGQFTRPIFHCFQRATKVIGVSLHPWAGNILFRTPAQEFTNSAIGIDLIDKKTDFANMLNEAETDNKIVFKLEEYLKPRLLNQQLNEISKTISLQILLNPSSTELRRLVREFRISRRRIEQIFLETTGISMGLFLRKIRFQRAVRLLKKFPQQTLTRVGLEAGYYDQAHFIRDFHNFADLSPGEYLTKEFGMKSFAEELMLVN